MKLLLPAFTPSSSRAGKWTEPAFGPHELPASKLFGLDAGVLAPGKEADLAVFDLDHAEKLAEEDYLSKGVNTPFTGQEVYGMTALTFVSGKLVYKSKHFAD